MTIMAVAVLLTTMALLSLVEAVPVPNTQEITLQVPSEILKEHTLVLTLSPLPATGKSLGKGEASGTTASAGGASDEGQTKGKAADREGRGKAATEGEANQGGIGGQAEKQRGDEMVSTTMKPNTTMNANGTTSETPSTVLKTTVAPTVVVHPFVEGDTNVPELILQFPEHSRCPEGYAPDMNGKCRQLFKPSLPGAKSLVNSAAPELSSQAV